MVTDWLKVILAIAPKAKREIAEGLAAAMPGMVDEFDIDTRLRQAHFLAQCAHESDGFKTTVEYASGDAYDTRTDLGFTAARDGDGRKFKGFGLIQTTGPKNQRKAAVALGILAEWLKRPRILADFPYAARSAGYYWKTNGCNVLADRDDVLAVTKRVNGGTNGLADRKTYLARAKVAIAKSEGDEVHPADSAKAAGTILPRARIRDLQAKLGAVYPLGKADGLTGTLTVASISAFQADNDIPVTGAFDPATVEAIDAGVPPRPVIPARANGAPENSAILAHVRRLKIGAALAGSPAAVALVSDPLTSLEKASGAYTRVKAAMEPFGGLPEMIGDHWPLAVIAVAAAVFMIARSIGAARVADYQTGKTP